MNVKISMWWCFFFCVFRKKTSSSWNTFICGGEEWGEKIELYAIPEHCKPTWSLCTVYSVQCKVYSVNKNIYRVQPIIDWETEIVIVQLNQSSLKRGSSTQTSSKLIRLDNSLINKSSLKRSSSTKTSSKLICREIKILCWFVCLYCSIVSKILNYFWPGTQISC